MSIETQSGVIIVPVTNTASNYRDCIMQESHRYCQDEPVSAQGLGVLLLGLVIFASWFAFLFWQWVEREANGFKVWGLGLALPLAVLGIALALS